MVKNITKEIDIDSSLCTTRMIEYLSNTCFQCDCTDEIQPVENGKSKVLVTGNEKLVDRIIYAIGKTIEVGVDNVEIPEFKRNEKVINRSKVDLKYGYQ